MIQLTSLLNTARSTASKTRVVLERALLAMASVGVCLATVTSAHAEERASADDGGIGRMHIAVDYAYALMLDYDNAEAGTGRALRIGREYDLLLITLIPEIGGTYDTFTDGFGSRIYGGFAGGRLAVGKIIEPSVFGHVGVARIEGWQERTAPLLDAGLALDLTLLPLIDIGAHAGINTLLSTRDSDHIAWAEAGVQAALVF